MDGLSDYREVVGFPCGEDPEIDAVETNPLLPDSNGDGLRDGDEFHNDQCRKIGYSTSPESWGEPIVSGEPYAWRDDNDGDGVPDALDLPEGCRFEPRCIISDSRCSRLPPRVVVGEGHTCLCWKAGGSER